MEWVSPLYSRKKVDAAGEALVLQPTTEELDSALTVVSNWRSAHSRPLYTFRFGLRRYAEEIDPNVLVAQRIKRLSSISLKLILRPNMKLSQMQDIGGCRAVVNSVDEVQKLYVRYKSSEIKHKLITVDHYILTPKASGYRSLHLVYKYFSDRKATHNGLRIEVQIRSQLQHAWATAVETVGTFIRQGLKSSQGEADWLRFFALMGTALAEREQSAPVPNTPTDPTELKRQLRELASKLDVSSRLQAYGKALNSVEGIGTNSDYYYLLELDPSAMKIRVSGYKQKDLEQATAHYLDIEKTISGTSADAVLVSVDSMASLRRAYPNYFLDTNRFVEAVNQAIA
jgi:Region found in RelA / SpoT proteins